MKDYTNSYSVHQLNFCTLLESPLWVERS